MSAPGDLEVKQLRMSLAGSPGGALRPVVHGGEVTIPSAGFVAILGQLLKDEIVLPQAQLRYVSSKLIDGGAEFVIRAKRGSLDQNVRARVSLAAAGNGDLRVTILDMKVGMLPAGWMLDFVLSAVDKVEGLRKSGQKSIDVNLATLLKSRDVPVELATGVTAVQATASELTIRL
jgi:hypothetical protein